MKDKLLQIIILVAVLCLAIGIISRLIATKILIQGHTWMNLSQTILLLAIAFGISKLIDLNKK
jgi:hypothetical protein